MVRDRRSVPSSPEIGSEDISSLITGLSQARSSRRASRAALRRVLRDRPEPLSSTKSSTEVAAPVRSTSQRVSVSRAASGVAGSRGAASRARVKKSCCDIRLLLNLLMSRTTSASGGERSSKAGFKSSGAVPSRTLPCN